MSIYECRFDFKYTRFKQTEVVCTAIELFSNFTGTLRQIIKTGSGAKHVGVAHAQDGAIYAAQIDFQ